MFHLNSVVVCPEDVWEIRGGKHQCALPPTVTLPLPECVTSKSWLYNLYYYISAAIYAVSCLKKGSLFRVHAFWLYSTIVSLLHLQPKLPDRCVVVVAM